MRIVMCYQFTDCCTYWCPTAIPILYDSCEQALVDFEAALNNTTGEFSIFGTSYYKYDFIQDGEIILPDFLTVDEWYERECEANCTEDI